ncbi:alkaline phosphatase family protein [Rhizomicrobium electricum]|uniref:Alkaline phosphatase family protein n=1 Tax=Rhizomicrobium electricum TaxID=480070 RepID=A0ABN1ETC8_9PROT|nr:alkaline phosphatase family protein [Rhizomicrobium electricum]
MRVSALALATSVALTAAVAGPPPSQRNVIIFVADGLRYDSVTPETAPTLAKVRREGVDFANSHSVYPTLTTVNAAVIATGHYPGDNGNYGNRFNVDAPLSCANGSTVAFAEDNCALREVKKLWPKDYLGQTTIIEAARKAGLNTVLVGKRGPLAIQYLSALDSRNDDIGGPVGIFLDEAAGRSPQSPTLSGELISAAEHAAGQDKPAATTVPNLTQQAWQASVVSQVLLPRLKQANKPFAMLFWSRDPDITQHMAADSDGMLTPGINSANGRMAIYNADTSLKIILDALKRLGLDDNTDVLVVADHGFSTIAKSVPAPNGSVSGPELPFGFLARDVAGWLGAKTFDPSRNNAPIDFAKGETPKDGDVLIGATPDAPQALITNNNNDYIYIPAGPNRRQIAKRIFAKLLDAPYVGALFVNDDLMNGGDKKDFAGALPMSQVNLIGSSRLPTATIVVGFRTFVNPACTLGELLCAAEVSDISLHVGQGNHGSFSRADTRNFMAAIGPDFKAGAVITSPVGNMDVAPTAAHLLGIALPGTGKHHGRVIGEALKGGKEPKVLKSTIASDKAPNGVQTVVVMQMVGDTKYFDAGGIPGRMVGIPQQ